MNIDYVAIPGTVTLDPGDNTGWARWGTGLNPLTGSFTYGKVFRKAQRVEQIFSLGQNFESMIKTLRENGHTVDLVVIEEVQVWSGSLNSMAAATRGDLFKLSMVIGTYLCKCGQMNIPVKLVKPNEWKGQLPDDAVARRVNQITGNEYPNPHIYSAVGIGLNEMDIFKTMGVKRGR